MFYVSTIAHDASALAREFGMGLEIAEFCTAWNMDEEFSQADTAVKQKLEGISATILHAPYNELFPCAIDKKARSLAAERYRQAIALAGRYGAQKVVIHGGYHPLMYYPVWYVEQSILFWKEFLREDPGVEIVLENVLETEPQWLADIVKAVDHPRLRLCLDVGHVNAYSKIPVENWLDSFAPWLSHVHIHNNDGTQDQHMALHQGNLSVKDVIRWLGKRCPDATITLELMEAESSVRWLKEEGLWNCGIG